MHALSLNNPERAQVYNSVEVYYPSGTLNGEGVGLGVHFYTSQCIYPSGNVSQEYTKQLIAMSMSCIASYRSIPISKQQRLINLLVSPCGSIDIFDVPDLEHLEVMG